MRRRSREGRSGIRRCRSRWEAGGAETMASQLQGEHTETQLAVCASDVRQGKSEQQGERDVCRAT